MNVLRRTSAVFRAATVVPVIALALLLVTTLVPAPANAVIPASGDTNTCDAGKTFLGLKAWYAYLGLEQDPIVGGCKVTFPTDSKTALGAQSPFLLIALAIVDDLLRIATLVAVGYVIVGGFKYMTSNGSPDGTKQARNTIINALVGLVIAILAAAIVDFIGNRLGGSG